MALAVGLCGCARFRKAMNPPTAAAEEKTSAQTPADGAEPEDADADSSAEQTDDLSRLLDDVQRQGKLNTAERAALENDLRTADPTSRQILLSYFRASLGNSQAPDGGGALARAAAVSDANDPWVWRRDEPEKNRAPAAASAATRLPPPPEKAFDQMAEMVRNHADYPRTDNRAEPGAAGSNTHARLANWPTDPDESRIAKASADAANGQNLVRRVSYTGPAGQDWRQDLQRSIRGLEAQTTEPPHSAEDVERHAALRLLYVVAGRREDALRPIPGVSAAQQDFWSKEIYGLATYLDSRRIPNGSRRATEAARYFREASARLSESASLLVNNVTFCTRIRSFGVVERFPQDEFQPRQETLLYAEIENFKSELGGDGGYHTSLKASYQVIDSRGQRVFEDELPPIEETCQQMRRDFFLSYRIRLPERIYNGKHTLQLTIEDTLSQKIGTASLEFMVKEKPSKSK